MSASPLSPTLDAALDAVGEVFPCKCEPGQPDCRYCVIGDALVAAIQAEVAAARQQALEDAYRVADDCTGWRADEMRAKILSAIRGLGSAPAPTQEGTEG